MRAMTDPFSHLCTLRRETMMQKLRSLSAASDRAPRRWERIDRDSVADDTIRARVDVLQYAAPDRGTRMRRRTRVFD